MLNTDLFNLPIDSIEEIKLVGGELSVIGFSKLDTIVFNQILRKALLDCELPHYKVIGIDVNTSSNLNLVDCITPIQGTNKSYIEIATALNSLVFDKSDGTGDASLPGQFKDNKFGFITASGNVKSDNSFIFSQTGLMNKPKTLIKGLDICKFDEQWFHIDCIIANGTGVIDFDRNQYALSGSPYRPVRTIYDLNSYMCILPEITERGTIKFLYKVDVDESVLLNIIKSFIRRAD